jgi:hypothetical protein
MILRNLSNRAFFRLQVQSHYALFERVKTKMDSIELLLAETYKKKFRMKAIVPQIFSTTHFLV